MFLSGKLEIENQTATDLFISIYDIDDACKISELYNPPENTPFAESALVTSGKPYNASAKTKRTASLFSRSRKTTTLNRLKARTRLIRAGGGKS